MTKFVALASAKGGVGKTSISLNLGMSLHQAGSRVLVVDTHFSNPQILKAQYHLNTHNILKMVWSKS